MNVDGFAMDAVMNIRTLAVLGLHHRFAQEYKRLLRTRFALVSRNNWMGGVVNGVALCLLLFTFSLCFFVGAKEVDSGYASAVPVSASHCAHALRGLVRARWDDCSARVFSGVRTRFPLPPSQAAGCAVQASRDVWEPCEHMSCVPSAAT